MKTVLLLRRALDSADSPRWSAACWAGDSVCWAGGGGLGVSVCWAGGGG